MALLGPRFKDKFLPGGEEVEMAWPTWRGWVLGVGSVLLLSVIVVRAEFVLQSTTISQCVMPYASVGLVFALVLIYNFLVARFRTGLGLTKHDVALVFCMTFVANTLPGYGYSSYLLALIASPEYYGDAVNGWHETILPLLDEGLRPSGPTDPNTDGPQPIVWLFSGLPPGESIPWSVWIGPLARWSLMMMFAYGVMVSVCALLQRHWSDSEKLPFPLAQVPEEMWSGWGGSKSSWEGLAGREESAFFLDRLVWWGIGLTVLLHLHNGLHDFYTDWPVLELKNTYAGREYFTEPPWNALRPLHFVIYPAIIGLVFLISLEISFSLWFFFILLKILVLIAVASGLGSSHGDFLSQTRGVWGMFTQQGTGAVIAMVLISFWMARRAVKRSFKEAMGWETEPEEPAWKSRILWIVLIGSFLGLVAWLCWAGVGVLYALIGVVAWLVLAIGLARLGSLGAIATRIRTTPFELTSLATPPATMGAPTVVPLSIWSRLIMFDFFRTVPTVPIITSLHLAGRSGLRRAPLYVGLTLAFLMGTVLGPILLISALYQKPGGASTINWQFRSFPKGEFRNLDSQVRGIRRHEELAAQPGAAREKVASKVVERDGSALFWTSVGAGVTTALTVLRARWFWFPHPVGYVVWADQRIFSMLWFSFFLGWAIKGAIVKYGGRGAFLRARRFFLGVIVGESLFALLWIGVHWIAGEPGGYDVGVH